MKLSFVRFCCIAIFSVLIFSCNSGKKEIKQTEKDYSNLTEEEQKIEKSIDNIEKAMDDLNKAMEKIKEEENK